jgi:hypothetical protein
MIPRQGGTAAGPSLRGGTYFTDNPGDSTDYPEDSTDQSKKESNIF